MKMSVLALSMVFSSMAFAAPKSYDAGPNCSSRTTTDAHSKDKRLAAKETLAETLPLSDSKKQNQDTRTVRDNG